VCFFLLWGGFFFGGLSLFFGGGGVVGFGFFGFWVGLVGFFFLLCFVCGLFLGGLFGGFCGGRFFFLLKRFHIPVCPK